MARPHSAKFKFQVVKELLCGNKSAAQVPKAYGIHPNTARDWKNTFLEKGPDILAEDSVVAQYERRIAELEQLVGKKEVEIALSERLLGLRDMTPERRVSLVESVKDTYGLNRSLAAAELPKSTRYYHQNDRVDYGEKYRDLKPVLEEIAREHPQYGLPRIMAELREVYDCGVNHKVVERLLWLWDLRVMRGTRRRKPSGVRKAIWKPETGPIWWLRRTKSVCFGACMRI